MNTLDILIEAPVWDEGMLAPLAERAVEATLHHMQLDPEACEVAVLACDDARIATLNAEFRDKPTPTNVLSWPTQPLAPPAEGKAPPQPERGFDDMRRRWFPDSARNVLQHLSGVFAASTNSAQRIRRLGVPEARITVTGRLQEGGCVLPVSLTEREELSKALAGRSLWLAAGVQPDEMELILAAHHAASRLAHRLLLVIVPARDEDAQTFETRLQDEGWRVALWSHGDRPNENTQILLADSAEDMGLWYRVAPITLMAGSLLPGCTGQDPYEAAALGSAILFGPFVADHRDPYRRLSDAGGARLVRGADALGKALIRLIAPDQAASMALAGWEVASSGAEVTDRVSDLIQDALDQGQAR